MNGRTTWWSAVTLAVAVAAPAAAVETRDRVWIKSGTLNGQAIGGVAPAIEVTAGERIRGEVVIEVTNSHDEKTVFPIYITPTWGWPSQSYTSQGPGTQRHTQTIDCVASLVPGTYYILFAATAQANGVCIGSLTRGRDEVRWDDANLTDLTGFQIAHAQQHGWTEVLEYGPMGYQTAAYGLAVITVKVRASAPEPGLVAHWAFDEPAKSKTVVLESSGHGRHGTLAAPGSYQTLDNRHTLWFDRRQCVTAADPDAFSLDRFTIESVVWLGGGSEHETQCLAAKGEACFLGVDPGNRLRLSLRGAGEAECRLATDENVVTDRRWYRIVGAFDGHRLHLGVTDLQTGLARTWSVPVQCKPSRNRMPMTIGAWCKPTDDPPQIREGLNGWVDYVKVYSVGDIPPVNEDGRPRPSGVGGSEPTTLMRTWSL